MICQKCQKENRGGSKFCRFCGSNLSEATSPASINATKYIKLPVINLSFLIQHYRLILLTLFLFFITGAGVYASPKIRGYLAVDKIIRIAEEFGQGNNYTAAISILNSAEGLWALDSQKNEIEHLKGETSDYLNYQKLLNEAQEKEKGGELEEARDILKSIDSSFPQYDLVKVELDQIQNKIEENLKEEIQLKEVENKRAAAAEAEAKRKAQLEAGARAEAEAEQRAAEAQARAEADARARAQAQADAAARAARDAEVRRQQEEQQKLEERRISFLNQLSSIYSAANSDGISYYNNAMSYYNSGSELAALAGFGQARAIFVNAYNNALSLKNAFSGGMSSTYLAAVNNMMYATDNYDNAVDSMINDIANGGYGNANYYANNGDTYMRNVRSFLISQGY